MGLPRLAVTLLVLSVSLVGMVPASSAKDTPERRREAVGNPLRGDLGALLRGASPEEVLGDAVPPELRDLSGLAPGSSAARTAASAVPCTAPSVTYATIQAAIDDANCDPIMVPAGTFTENLTIERSLTLAGAGSGATRIDGAASNPTVAVADGTPDTVVIRDLTLANGAFLVGGGLIVGNPHNVTLERVVVTENLAIAGGGLFAIDSTVTVIDSTISDNDVVTGGGGSFGAGATTFEPTTTLTLQDSTVTGNQTDSDAGNPDEGGGIYNEGTVNVVVSSVTGNTAENAGGGILNLGTLSVANSLIQ
ncbi:MAG TPA: hypothetical protein VFZ45_03825, partial [Actinomycetota bacterium]|nr:hypothetical protein [Actinomycetota bacterium]